MGYAGGEQENPTYRKMGDHTETLQVDYDASLISYGELLETYWSSHNPFRQTTSRQYMNIIFVHNDEQERLARDSKALLAQQQNRNVATHIVSFSKFYLAEDYHQKYYLQSISPLMKEYMLIFSDFEDFVHSTAAARVNGYVAGYGDTASLTKELAELGLSEAGTEILQRLVKR